jgi:hypothetical protein
LERLVAAADVAVQVFLLIEPKVIRATVDGECPHEYHLIAPPMLRHAGGSRRLAVGAIRSLGGRRRALLGREHASELVA